MREIVQGQIAKASTLRLMQAGTIVFLLQYVVALLLGMLIFMPIMFWGFIPIIESAESGVEPDVTPFMIMFPLLFIGMFLVQIAATAIALGFAVGKKWRGAQLIFVEEQGV